MGMISCRCNVVVVAVSPTLGGTNCHECVNVHRPDWCDVLLNSNAPLFRFRQKIPSLVLPQNLVSSH